MKMILGVISKGVLGLFLITYEGGFLVEGGPPYFYAYEGGQMDKGGLGALRQYLYWTNSTSHCQNISRKPNSMPSLGLNMDPKIFSVTGPPAHIKYHACLL